MRLSKSVYMLAIATVALMVAAPARAQHRGGGGRAGGSAGVRGPAPRAVAPRAVFAPRAGVAPRFGSAQFARPSIAGPRFSAARGFAPRSFAGGARPAFAQRGVIAARGFGGRRGFAPRFIGPRIIVSPFRFARPFYAFRPRFSVGFGLWAGFPVAYPYYGYPYAYGYPYPYAGYPYPYGSAYPYGYPAGAYGYPDPAYGYPSAPYPAQPYPSQSYPAQTYPAQGYPPSGSIEAQAGRDSGGVSFEISPNTARVIVDGTDVGTVAEFSPNSMPLTLTPGRHHIELRVAGYQTMSFDAEIVAGQVIPYRGDMQPVR